MKKLFTLMTLLLFAVIAKADPMEVIYEMVEGETHSAGETVDVKSEDDVTVATLTFGFTGGAEFKAAKKNSGVEGFSAYTEGNGENGKADSGTVYIIKPYNDGTISVAVVLNADKGFFVLEDETALPGYNGITVSEKYYGTYTFNVKANSEYKVYADGTKLGFYGIKYNFENTVVVEDPILKAGNAKVKTYVSGEPVSATFEITGKNLTGSAITVTPATNVDGLSVSIADNTIKDNAIETTATVTYTATANAQGTVTLIVSDGKTNAEATVDYLALINRAQLVAINGDNTWDFSVGITGGVDFGKEDPEKDIEFTYTDFAKIANFSFTTDFKAESLAFKGTYPRRVGKEFAQDGVLHFKTEVPGYIEVKFTDTGSGATADAVKRYLAVNGEATEYWTSRENNGSNPFPAQLNVISGQIFVPAGDVYISGVDAQGEKASLVYNYVKFTKTDVKPEPEPEPEAPATPTVSVDGVDNLAQGLDIKGQATVVKIKAADASHNVYAVFVPADNSGAKAAAEASMTHEGLPGQNFALVGDAGVTVKEAGTLYYFAHDPSSNLKSELGKLSVTDSAVSGIGSLNNDADAPVEFYNLQGVRVANPEHGIFIRRQGNNVSKVIVR